MKYNGRNNKVFNYSHKQIVSFLISGNHPFPELKSALQNPSKILKKEQTKIVLNLIKKVSPKIKNIPKLNHILYNSFFKTGERDAYEKPYNERREYLSSAVFLYILGRSSYKDIIEKYLLAICKEETWVVPCHKGRMIDLYSSNTARILAEVFFIMGDKIDEKVSLIVRESIEEKIFDPYLNQTSKHKWYKNHNNWNAVCNSDVAIAFLLLEKNIARKARAIKKALDSLEVYINKAFYEDGGTSEGVHYWNYGLSMFVIFSEMLKSSTGGKIDLLKTKRVKQIATLPSKMQLSSETFASFSDTSESSVVFNPGIMQKLLQATGEKSLSNFISESSKPDWLGISNILRYVLWWNKKQVNQNNIYKDSVLPDLGIVRLVNESRKTPAILIIKAGHNNENHNHNDLGSYIINIDGENFVTDPGAGLYDKDYFSAKRYNSIFANSYGHSVPRVNNKLQSKGKKYFAKLISTSISKYKKRVTVELVDAYSVKSLISLNRKIILLKQNAKIKNSIIFNDEYIFLKKSSNIEEVFITWLKVTAKNKEVIIYGKKYNLILTIKQPDIASDFLVEELKKESLFNKKPRILKRITFNIPKTNKSKVSVKVNMRIEKRN